MRRGEIFACLGIKSLTCLNGGVELLKKRVKSLSFGDIRIWIFFIFLNGFYISPQSLADERTPEESVKGQIGSLTEKPAEFTYADAKKLLNKKKWDEAIIILRHLEEKEPNSIFILSDLARAFFYTGHREEALKVLVQASDRVGASHRLFLNKKVRVISRLFLTNKTFEYHQLGLNFLFDKKYRNAAERFEKALAEESDNVEILIRLGQSLVLDERPKSAIEPLTKAKKLNPYEPEVRLWLGRALFLSGTVNESIPELKVAYTELRNSELAPIWLTEALSSQGQVNASIRLLEADLKTSPFHIMSLISIARLRFQGRPDTQMLWQARKDLQLANSRLEPYLAQNDSAPSHYEKGHAEGELGINLKKSQSELKGEIQRLLQQIQNRLDEPLRQR